jgi:hypothetical protein
MLKTIEFMKANSNWRDLLKEKPYALHINEDDNYVLFKYNQIDSDFNEEICRECRGLVIDKNKLEPVALSFYKFFNVQETFADKIDWDSARVLEKVDGSKMMVWWDIYSGQWRVSTSSQLDAKNAPVGDFGISFQNLFDRALINYTFPEYVSLYDYLSKNCCYTFELVTPESRVVVPYNKDALYLIGIRELESFEEIDPALTELSKFVKKPKQFNLLNLKDCLNKVEHMGYNEEGFVVVDKYWKRIKIKSPAYVAAHYLKNNGVNSKYRMLRIIEKGEQSEFLSYFPEYTEYIKEIEDKRNKILTRIKEGITNIVCINNEDMFESRKETAQYINKHYSDVSGIIFKYLDTNIIDYFVNNEWNKLSKEKKMTLLGYKLEKED